MPDDTTPGGAATALRQAADHLRGHPWIGTAEVRDGAVVIAPAPDALAVRPVPGPLVAEHLEHWSEVYDWTYTEASGRHAGDLDLSGWRATGTGEPFPVAHMRDWLRHTAGLVLRARPRWVLELGCGTGLLTHRLAPHIEGYVGTDVAAASVATLAATAPPGVRVLKAAAHEAAGPAVRDALAAAGFPGARPDCVVLNSVTQCFPDTAYLRAVLHDAIGLVADGGTVVVGDVRHAGLLDAHCRLLERAAAPGLDDDEVARRAAERAARDEELLFDPPLLARLAAAADRDVRMAVHPKTMRDDTELTRYRFDAVLHVGPGAPAPAPPPLPWTALPAAGRLAALTARVDAGPLRVHDIPNGLLTGDGPRPAELDHALAGRDAAILMDAADPALLHVVAPAAAAPRPAAELAGPGRAHEPLPAFARRRLAEAARRELSRLGGEPVPVRVAGPAPADTAGGAA
jgi:SAM-dependent methyltransferase